MKRRALIGFILCLFLYTTAQGSYVRSLKEIGAGIVGRAVTQTLYVSLNGTGNGGLTWATAYTTIQGALDAASIDADDCTLILISPKATAYDINTTGDPTWGGNYILKGSHRNWAKITNNHGAATSVLKFTGKGSLIDVTIDCGSGSLNGVIFNGGSSEGARLNRVYFECEDVTGAQTAVEISGSVEYAKFQDVMIHGEVSNTTGILLDDCGLGAFIDVTIYTCLVGLQITDIASDSNRFLHTMLHECALALDLDAGNLQMWEHIDFHGCIRNVDDEVGDHLWTNVHGEFPIALLPDDFTGVDLDTDGAGDTWGTDTEILAAAGRDNPFRVIGISVEADANEKFRVRLSADSGITHFLDVQFEGSAAAAVRPSFDFPSETEEIFNKGIRISGSSKSESGGDTATVWLQIQEI